MTITTKSGSSFKGNSFAPNTPSYARANNIYSSSTYNDTKDPKGPNFRNLNPSEILQPSSIEDIIWVVKTASKMGKPLAIRSGGHQYSGASSTGPQGIQIDLQPTFRRPNVDLNILRENGKVYLRSSVSWKLTEIFDFLKDNGVFMPTGQCSTVCLGGHVQTGGYGMLARSFGLLGDWVRELEIVDYKGDVLKVTKDSHPDLFFGFLGGSPGNLGVLTHFKIEVQDDNNHQGSKGMWAGFGYSEETLKTLLDLLVKKGEDPKFPRGYDFTVNIVSRQANLLDLFPGTEDELKKKLPDRIHDGKDNIADLLKFKYAMIVVYAQWVNLHEEPYSDDLFNQIKNVPNEFKIIKEAPDKTPMSYIASMWLFASPREFPYPYDKRTNSTASTQLSKSGWSSWFASRVNEVIKDKNNGLWVSSQLQVYGGEQSMFRRNKGNGTAYTFRDAAFSGTWDVFFQGTREAAAKWQDENDKGRAKYFSKEDRRVLWGSYGDWNMKNVWQHYYDPETYKKVQKIRKTYDPNGTFTANPFCVEALK